MVSAGDNVRALEKFANLLEAGAIDADEFASIKGLLLGARDLRWYRIVLQLDEDWESRRQEIVREISEALADEEEDVMAVLTGRFAVLAVVSDEQDAIIAVEDLRRRGVNARIEVAEGRAADETEIGSR
jgi:hypothetical protein